MPYLTTQEYAQFADRTKQYLVFCEAPLSYDTSIDSILACESLSPLRFAPPTLTLDTEAEHFSTRDAVITNEDNEQAVQLSSMALIPYAHGRTRACPYKLRTGKRNDFHLLGYREGDRVILRSERDHTDYRVCRVTYPHSFGMVVDAHTGSPVKTGDRYSWVIDANYNLTVVPHQVDKRFADIEFPETHVLSSHGVFIKTFKSTVHLAPSSQLLLRGIPPFRL